MITELLQLAGCAGAKPSLSPSTRAMLDALPYPAFVTDADGTTLYSNLQYQTYAGLPAEALMGNAWAALIHPEDSEQAAASWISALVLGAAIDVEYRLYRADGAARWFRRRAAPQFDGKGRICYWFGTLEDIHDEKTLEVSEKAGKTAAAPVGSWPQLVQQPEGVGIFEWDPITEELLWSPDCKAAFGSPPDEEPTDEVFQARLHPEDRPAVLERIRHALDPNGPGRYRSQHRVIWPNGSLRWMRAHGTAAFDEVGRFRRAVHFSGTVLDVTDAKRTEGELSDRPGSRKRQLRA